MKKPCAALLFLFTTAVIAQSNNWVGTWSTASVPALNAAPITAQAPPTTPTPAHELLGSRDITLREIVHISLGGPALRVVLTNEYGTGPLTISAATVALQTTGSQIQSARPLTFNGRPGIVIPPGAITVSDAVTLAVSTAANLAVSLFLPAQTIACITTHAGAMQTSYTAPGDASAAAALDNAMPIYSWNFLKAVDVRVPAAAGAIVVFGDSITDGVTSTRDANARWPDGLARRLAANPATANLSVLNEGIGGNRILKDMTSPSGLARFTRDALDQAGVRYIIILEGINDIGNTYTTNRPPTEVATAADLIQGYTQLIERAHLHHIKVIGATLTPYMGAFYSSPAGEQVRQTFNQWIRTTKSLDGVIDFDKATQDPVHSDTYLPANDHGDHLHPSDAGYAAMSNAIDLSLFTK